MNILLTTHKPRFSFFDFFFVIFFLFFLIGRQCLDYRGRLLRFHFVTISSLFCTVQLWRGSFEFLDTAFKKKKRKN